MDIKEIERAMHTLACGDTNFDTVSRLAALVTVHDHLSKSNQPAQVEAYSSAPSAQVPAVSGSEFLDAVAEAPLEEVIHILDEHMEALRIVIPAEYNVVINRLNRLRS